MRRLAVVGRHPGRSLGVLAALLVAGGAAIGSGAAFTTQTANPSNTFSSGILKVSSDGNGAVLNASNLVPGEGATGSVTIANDGTVDGSAWTLTQAVSGETAGSDPADPSSTGRLSDRLALKIVDTTTGDTVYDGALASLTSHALPTIAKGTSHKYDFTVTLQPGANDNAYEGGSLTSSYTWSASAGS